MDHNNPQGRAQVYCHQCENEWYQDEHGIDPCPSCGGQITEIIDPDNDPRESALPPMPSLNVPRQDPWTTGLLNHDHFSHDDIHATLSDDAQAQGRGWTSTQSSSRPNNNVPSWRQRAADTPSWRRGSGMQDYQTPGMEDDIGPGFMNMLQMLGGADRFTNTWNSINAGMPPSPGHHYDPHRQQTRFPVIPMGQSGFQSIRTQSVPGSPRNRAASPSMAAPGRPHIEIFATSSNMDRPFYTSRRINTDDPNDRGQPMPFPEIEQLFGNIFGQVGTNNPTRSADEDAGGGIPAGHPARGLFGMISSIIGGNTSVTHLNFGDAVFSDEALDRVMSQLMNENPSGQAPGPASQEAIRALPRVKATKRHLGEDGKADCSICMSEIKLGDEIVELPCGHWFDEDCVKHWLSEHDTCPVCRAGIMPEDGSDHVVRQPNQAPLHDESPASVLRRQTSNQTQSPTMGSRRQSARQSFRRGADSPIIPSSFPSRSGTAQNPIVVEESPTADRRRPREEARRRSSGGNVSQSSSRSGNNNTGSSVGNTWRRFFGSSGSGNAGSSSKR